MVRHIFGQHRLRLGLEEPLAGKASASLGLFEISTTFAVELLIEFLFASDNGLVLTA